ncbi:benzoate transporter [Ochrobactrum sp. MR28]|nr:benzoate transporter [Ochrobactrum sp. MR28]MBX8818739.1 benzoate transporter [Ochrobactrum sp. MR31]
MYERSIIERGPGYAAGIRDFSKYLNIKTVSAGFVAAIFGCSGPALIVIGAAGAGNLTNGQTVAWLFSIYFLGGLISLIMALYYKQPISGAYSIPGAALVAGSLVSIPFDQAVGGFILAGVIVLLLGVTGLIGKIMRWLPMPIVMAMIAGALIRFATGTVTAAGAAPIIAGSAIAAFFISMRFIKVVPPVLSALLVGFIAAYATGSLGIAESVVTFAAPEFTWPTFTIDAFFAIAVPLALLVIGAENAQAIGVLMTEDYKPPINAMTVISGIGGIAAGCLGGHNANIAGPMTAICSSEQAGSDKAGRYAASVVNGVLFMSFGLVSGLAVPLVLALPAPLIATVAGLAMIGVLLTAFQNAFGKDHGNQIGAFVALAVAMSNISLLGISAAFWALVFGVVVSLVVETKTYKPA